MMLDLHDRDTALECLRAGIPVPIPRLRAVFDVVPTTGATLAEVIEPALGKSLRIRVHEGEICYCVGAR